MPYLTYLLNVMLRIWQKGGFKGKRATSSPAVSNFHRATPHLNKNRSGIRKATAQNIITPYLNIDN